MRLIVARCSVEYSGRLSARLPDAVRLLMFKADGSVLVHADGGGFKPLKFEDKPSLAVPPARGAATCHPRLRRDAQASRHRRPHGRPPRPRPGDH